MAAPRLSARRDSGFTLIELLVVILIIAILIAVAAPSFLGQTQKAEDSVTQQYLSISYRAAKAWAVDGGGSGSHAQDSFSGFNGAALHGSEPEIDAADGSCPTDATSSSKHVVVDTTQTSGSTLVICAGNSKTSWTLTSSPATGHRPVLSSDPSGPSSAPANDDFANAQVLSGNSGSVSGTLVGATVEDSLSPPEEDTSDSASYDSNLGDGYDATRSVWYTWTAPSSDTYVFTLAGSPAPFDGSSQWAAPALDFVDITGSSSWSGQSSWGGLFAQVNNSYNGGYAPTMVEGLVAGDTYAIRVANAPAGSGPDAGAFTLSWRDATMTAEDTTAPFFLAPSLQVQGTAQVGQTLSATDGAYIGVEWAGSPTFFVYTWAQCTLSFSCTDVATTNVPSYTVAPTDVGYVIIVSVIAYNAYGSYDISGANWSAVVTP